MNGQCIMILCSFERSLELNLFVSFPTFLLKDVDVGRWVLPKQSWRVCGRD